uniref:DNA polymerase eta n=1 Tax=Ascaris lumbricoides TaxID=6252 RepID=A0A9J2PWC2_ASCLU
MGGGDHRVIALIDMDCFYAQVEQRLQPHLWGKPIIVAQYSNIRGGGILAVSYEARPFGIKRFGMFAEQAKALCPELTVCYVPSGEHSDKADHTRYRNASAEVFDVLNGFDSRIIVERASIDEAYLDLSELVDYIIESETPSLKYSCSLDMFPTTHLANGNDIKASNETIWKYDREANLREWIIEACVQQRQALRLAVAAEIVERIRAEIKEKTQFSCSAGIGSNKMIAKLICSRHKPGQQTIIPDEFIAEIFRSTRILSIRNLGGKLGHALMNAFSIETMSELCGISMQQLNEHFSVQAKWIYNIARGIDDEPVRARDKQSSIAVSKNFPGSSALTSTSEVQTWLDGLVKELAKRLIDDQIKNKRTACTLHVSCTRDALYTGTTLGKSCQIVSYAPDALYNAAWAILRHYNNSATPETWDPAIFNISLSASRFRDGVDQSSKRITEWISEKGEQLEAGRESEPPSQFIAPDGTAEPNVISYDAASVSGLRDIARAAEELDVDREQRVEHDGGGDINAGYSMDGFLPDSLTDIPEDLLANMPEDIKTELMMYYRQKIAQQQRPNSASPQSRKNRKRDTKKRPKRASTAAEPATKKISDFFKKS